MRSRSRELTLWLTQNRWPAYAFSMQQPQSQKQPVTTNSQTAPVIPKLTVKTGCKAGRIAGNHNATQF